MPTPTSIVRDVLQAYVASDRKAIEPLIAADFCFTSPLDNRIDRDTYFAHCWPNNETIAGFSFVRLVESGDQVFVTYECRSTSGTTFRNTEILTVRDGQLVEAEVYFGWNLPHEAEPGGFVPPAAAADPAWLTTTLAQLACADLRRSSAWFATLFERPADALPMAGLAEWRFAGDAGLQLFEDAANAGHGTLTLVVRGLVDLRDRLEASGHAPSPIEAATSFRLVRLRDPDGNLVVLAEPS